MTMITKNRIIIRESEIAKAEETETVYYEEKLTVFQYALHRYTVFDSQEKVPLEVIEAFVEKAVDSKDDFEWYLHFNGDLNDQLKWTFN